MAFFGRIQKAIAERKMKMREKSDKKFLSDVEKLERLEKQKADLEKKQFTRAQLKERKREIRAIKTERARAVVKKVGKGVSRVRSQLGQRSGARAFGGGQRDVFGGTRNVFSGEPEKKEKKPKTVTIKIQQ